MIVPAGVVLRNIALPWFWFCGNISLTFGRRGFICPPSLFVSPRAIWKGVQGRTQTAQQVMRAPPWFQLCRLGWELQVETFWGRRGETPPICTCLPACLPYFSPVIDRAERLSCLCEGSNGSNGINPLCPHK